MAYCAAHDCNLSSPCGMFDGVCGECEALCDIPSPEDEARWEAENPFGFDNYLPDAASFVPSFGEDDIPF